MQTSSSHQKRVHQFNKVDQTLHNAQQKTQNLFNFFFENQNDHEQCLFNAATIAKIHVVRPNSQKLMAAVRIENRAQ
jgi:hypothetical protein